MKSSDVVDGDLVPHGGIVLAVPGDKGLLGNTHVVTFFLSFFFSLEARTVSIVEWEGGNGWEEEEDGGE